jgi:septal ring factor EnvC (AmiA/AmiB activator)
MKPFFLIISVFVFLAPVFGQNSNNRIKELEKKRKEALQRIEETSAILNKNKATTKNTIYKLNVINDKIKARQKFLGEINKELTTINTDVEEVKVEYSDLSSQLAVKKEQYAKSLRLMTKRNKSEDKLIFLLSSKDFAQLTRRLRYLNEYSDYQKIQAIEIRNKQGQLDDKRNELEKIYRDKKLLHDKEQFEKSILDKEKNQQNAMIKNLKSKERQLSSEISKQKRLADNLNRQVENIIAEEARKAAASAAKEKNRTVETKGGYAMTQQEKVLSGDFGSNKGSLPFPVSQSGSIIVHFGEQKYQDLKYVESSSKGIDIQTRPGASAVAVYNGTVSKIFSVPGFNSSIIIRHGNYLTVYSNLISLFVRTGDKVKTGQSLGKIYSDAQQDNLTVMHFQLWKDTQRLNPESWLRR